MEATIKLYKRNIGIEAEKLQMVEDIALYLYRKDENPTTYTIQYQKIQLHLNAKIVLDQAYSLPLKADNYVYASILEGNHTYYYFIKKINWKSQYACELEMIMDVLNTYKMGTDYTFSPKTIIKRQHKDRLKYFSHVYSSFNDNDFSPWELDYDDEETYPWHNYRDFGYYKIDPNGFEVFEEPLWFAENGEQKEFLLWIKDKVNNKYILSKYRCKSAKVLRANFLVQDSIYALDLNEGENIIFFANASSSVGHVAEDYDFIIQILCNGNDKLIQNNVQYTKTYFEIGKYINALYYGTAGDIKQGFLRSIDLINEDLNPLLYGKKKETIHDEKTGQQSWNVVYDTTNEGEQTKIKGLLIPDVATNVLMSGFSTNRITPDMLSEGEFYYILLNNIMEHGASNYYFNGYAYGVDNFQKANGQAIPKSTDSAFENVMLEIQKSGDMLLCSVILFETENGSGGTGYKKIKQGLSFSTPYLVYIGGQTSITYGKTTTFDLDLAIDDRLSAIPVSFCVGYQWTSSGELSLSPYSNLQKYHTTLVRSIKVPYMPFNFGQDGTTGKIIIDSRMSLLSSYKGLSNVLVFNTENIEMNNPLETSVVSPMENIKWPKANDEDLNAYPNLYNFINVGTNNLANSIPDRNDKYESKMFHSEFLVDKIVYDSFAFAYKLELVDLDTYFENYSLESENDIQIDFYFTNTMNSRFAFKFSDFKTIDKKEQDFDEWLMVARNNENVLYTSAYLQYLQSGYNYDVKNKEASNTRNWILATGSIIGTLAAGVSAVATGGATIPLAIGMATATAGTLTNAIVTQGQNERSLQQKIDGLKIQSANVSGADDVDLLQKYCSNKLIHFTYNVSDRMKKLLLDLFYYYGYKENITGVPNMTSRRFFNFLQCEPILEFSSINMSEEIEEELKKIMRTGFTYYHKAQVINKLANGRYHSEVYWDINQEKENIEMDIPSQFLRPYNR